MKIGVALAQEDWPKVRTWSLAEIVDFGVRAERAGFDSLWTNDHYFLELRGEPRRIGFPEPFALLSHLAARTERVELGTNVIGAPFRSPGQLARSAKTLAELSGGRFILGLGAGWHEPELESIGLPTDHLVSRFEEYLEALLALLRDGRVDYDGRYVRLRGAEVALDVSPPVWIGASKPRMLELTARHAAGWNAAASAEQFPELLAELRAAEAAAGRPEGSLAVSAGASALLVPRDEAERLFAERAPLRPPAVGLDELRTVVDRFREQGCDHLILHFSGHIWSCYDVGQLELAAEALGLG
jgi:alkanesulfonate monooxygenase SsuD/methylene tetrahydromethanopterin reductase-like flavin-dependent oxidoreductase (luciferase family)